METIKRSQALELGLPRYFTGKPCKSGHVDERDGKSGRCITCIREWSIARYRDNRDEILQGLRERRLADEAFAQACRDRVRAYHYANLDKVRAKVRAARMTDEYRATRRADYASRRGSILAQVNAWRERNAPLLAATQRRYREANRGRINAKNAARARHIKVATPTWANMGAISAIYYQAAASGMHVDHIVPLRSRLVCGLHVEANLRPMPGLENQRKGNRHWPDMP